MWAYDKPGDRRCQGHTHSQNPKWHRAWHLPGIVERELVKEMQRMEPGNLDFILAE